jgi:hypothetical protein
MAGQSRIKTVAGLHQSKTLVDIPNQHLQRQFTSGRQSWKSKITPKGHQDKHTGKPLTMAKTQRHQEQHPEQQNCDQSQQKQRRPKPNFNHDTHREDAKNTRPSKQNVSRRPHSGTKHTQM